MRLTTLAVAIFLCACAAPEPSGPAPEARLRAVAELPPAQAELLAAYGQGGDEWETARERALEDAGLTRFLVENLCIEMVRAHRALGSADGGRAKRAFDRASAELVRIGEPGLPTLVALLEVADPVASGDAADVLQRIGRPAIQPVAELLERDVPGTRQRAASLLARLPNAGRTQEEALRARLIEGSEREPDWLVRAELTLTLGARGARDTMSEPWRHALQARLLDEDPAVFEAAAHGLATLGDPRAVPRLTDALERGARAGDLRRFQAAQAALVTLTRAGEQRSIADWRRWWSENESRLR